MNQNIENSFNHFEHLLKIRFKKSVPTTEDSIRYTFFAALLEKNIIRPENTILEYNHPNIQNAKIDTWLELENIRVAIEFKYFRKLPSGRNQPVTQKAGQLFKDFKRLKNVTDKSIMVLVMGKEMVYYFSNPNNGFTDFNSLQINQNLSIQKSYFLKKKLTFQKRCGEPFETNLTLLHSANLPDENELRIYEVL